MFDPQWFLQDEDGHGIGGCGSRPEEFMVLKYRADLLYYRGQFQEAIRLYAKVCLPLAVKLTEVIFKSSRLSYINIIHRINYLALWWMTSCTTKLIFLRCILMCYVCMCFSIRVYYVCVRFSRLKKKHFGRICQI